MLIDVHCHLDASAYPDPDVVCQQSREAGVAQVVAAGMGEVSNRRILDLHRQFPQQVWAALGLHPERLDASWTELETVLEQIERHRGDLVAVGEIGLPHYTVLNQRMTESQVREHQAFLEVLVKAAARSDLPVVLHAPHAMAAMALDVVLRHEPAGAVFHWHKSTPETTAAICAAVYLSPSPPKSVTGSATSNWCVTCPSTGCCSKAMALGPTMANLLAGAPRRHWSHMWLKPWPASKVSLWLRCRR